VTNKGWFTMAITTGVNHVATVTRDLGRLVRFYREAFGAQVRDMWRSQATPTWRHYTIDIGGGSVVHAFENPAATFPEGIFARGRIDHLALDVPDEATLELVRRRLVDLGASEGVVADFGVVYTVHFRDPDGMECEVGCVKTGARPPWPQVTDMTAHTAQDPDPLPQARAPASAHRKGGV
jgi:catechol 2,3-dioxygenase-like lactoylglutathione lyase family enzyme